MMLVLGVDYSHVGWPSRSDPSGPGIAHSHNHPCIVNVTLARVNEMVAQTEKSEHQHRRRVPTGAR